jgi:hypothetical protein
VSTLFRILFPEGAMALLLLLVSLAGCASTRTGLDPATPGAPQLGAPMPETSSLAGWVHKGRVLCGHSDAASGIEYQFDVVCGTDEACAELLAERITHFETRYVGP